jgi:hypothetical protein
MAEIPYVNSMAQAGLGSKISINTGTVLSPTYIRIFEVTSIKQSGRVAKMVEVTNLQSGAVERITTLVDSGTVECSGNRVVGDPGQIAAEAAFETLASNVGFQIELRKSPTQTTKGDTYTFVGVVSEYDPISEISVDKAITSTIKVTISNTMTFAAGS